MLHNKHSVSFIECINEMYLTCYPYLKPRDKPMYSSVKKDIISYIRETKILGGNFFINKGTYEE